MIESFSKLVIEFSASDGVVPKEDEVSEYFEAVNEFLRLQYDVPQQTLCLIKECLEKLSFAGKTNGVLVDEIKKRL